MTSDKDLQEKLIKMRENHEATTNDRDHSSPICTHCGQLTRIDEKKKKKNNGTYLGIILGHNIDLTMSNLERYEFKKDYETFKLRVTLINLVVLAIALLFPTRPMDAICHFLMVWYYCTLTIRESILIINGSKMHWWWVAHHYLACVVGGVALTWPDDEAYQSFRQQFILFGVYICLLQQLQYQYQSGCLRRLHSLGHGDAMDVTLEGFASWMFHGLTFLIPFLIVAYFIEMYHAYTLFGYWRNHETVWQVPALALLFGIVGCGNFVMVAGIIFTKFKGSNLKKDLRERVASTSEKEE